MRKFGNTCQLCTHIAIGLMICTSGPSGASEPSVPSRKVDPAPDLKRPLYFPEKKLVGIPPKITTWPRDEKRAATMVDPVKLAQARERATCDENTLATLFDARPRLSPKGHDQVRLVKQKNGSLAVVKRPFSGDTIHPSGEVRFGKDLRYLAAEMDGILNEDTAEEVLQARIRAPRIFFENKDFLVTEFLGHVRWPHQHLREATGRLAKIARRILPVGNPSWPMPLIDFAHRVDSNPAYAKDIAALNATTLYPVMKKISDAQLHASNRLQTIFYASERKRTHTPELSHIVVESIERRGGAAMLNLVLVDVQ